MRIEIFKGSVETLRPIAESWKCTSLGNKFGIEIDVNSHLADLQKMVDGEDADLLVLCDDVPVGYMGMTVFRSPLGNQRIANEHYYYVLPDRRGIGSLRLIMAAKRWAKDKGCTHIILTASTLASDLHDRVCSLYERFGMQKFETGYISSL